MAEITKEQVEHIAKLARVKLTEEEIQKLTPELASILEYISKLNQIDTTGVEPTAHVTGLENVLRKDDIATAHETGQFSDALLAQVPGRESNFVKVKGVMESK